MKKLFLCCLLFNFIQFTHAEDLENNVRDYIKSGDWSDFKIVDSSFGRVAATRAATEDKRTNTTLAFTYPTHDKCKLAPVEIIYKLDKPLDNDSEFEAYGNIQVDSGALRRVEAKIIQERGNEFVFIVVPDSNLDDMAQKGKTITVNFKGYGVVEFSLNGAKSAIGNAKSECKNFDFS